MIEIILGIIVIVSLLLILIVVFNNKFKFALIKIDKAEEDIELYLDKKRELLDKVRPIVKEEVKVENFLEELNDSKQQSYNNFQLHDLLKNSYNELFKTLDDNEKLLKSETLVKILEDLNDNEENIIGAIKYYNDTVVELNRLVVSFPSSTIAFFSRCKEKEFYNNEKREIFEILNNK
ncbi:MAG: LemA family protein [Bacilli bacterium]|nr:LemA family protein [Bacilli bacterium]